jgi:hypothetical protein
MHIGTHHNHAHTAAAKNVAPAAKATKTAPAAEKKADDAPKESVSLTYLPQDTGLIPVQQGQVEGKLEAGPSGPRLRVSVPRNFPQATPDKDGNFNFKPDDPNFDSVNTYFVAHQTLQVAEEYAGREIPWSFSKELGREEMIIHPHAGAGVVNAFYSSEGGSINFFSYKNDDKVVHRTGLQSDVVAHEAGHAILDALRPTYIRTLAVPAGGFHESFGDMIAMLRALKEPSIIASLKEETKGDLSKSNVVSRVAEQLGQDAYGTNYLRDAVNDHQFADQHFLPYVDREHRNPEGKPDGNSFGTEPHAYATLFTGAFYDLFGALYENAAKDPNVNFTDAVSTARDQAGELLLRAVEFAPIGNPAYPEMAEAFLQADAIDNAGALRPFIEEAFRGRNVINDENVQNFESRLQSTPNVKLRASATEEKGAVEFLNDQREALGLPEGVDFQFESSYKNKAGETFLTFSTQREGLLDDPDFGTNEGAKFEGVGGLVLGFDAKNKLFVKNYDEVTDREMSDIKNHVRSLAVAGNLIQGSGDAAHQHDLEAREKVHVVLVNDGNGPVLRKAPVLYC